MKNILFSVLLTLFPVACLAQVQQSELAGKYHLTATCEYWEASFADKVYAHDDFVFYLEAQEDGTFLLYSFFYNGMADNFAPLGYGATATYSYAEQLLTVISTPWMWDEYMGQFMDPYSHDPMLYFAVSRDADGRIRFSSTPNSLGFYYLGEQNGQNAFIYAIDYPGVVSASRVDTYPSVTRASLPGQYVMQYVDADGRTQTTQFSIAEGQYGAFVLSGMFGDDTPHALHFEHGNEGVYADLHHDIVDGYYVNYFGSNVGDCRVSFHFDIDGRLVLDNPISYTPDWINWTDAFSGVATKVGSSISSVCAKNENLPSYDLFGRPSSAASRGIHIVGDRKVWR
ncbi:MAG: hypothetical protein KBT20_01100 [Bacteroidales bacterium]|nr:hypothetical protein [Candidatus Liminaster caballi]